MSNFSIEQGSKLESIDLRSMFYDLMEHKWFILVVAFFTVLGGSFYALTRTPQYQANVLMQITNEQQSGAGILGSLTQLSGAGSNEGDKEAVQSALIHSRFILGPVITSLGLDIHATPYQPPILRYFFPSHKKIQIEKLEVPLSYVNTQLQLILDKPHHFILYTLDGEKLLQGAIGKEVSNKDHTCYIQINTVDASVGSQFRVIKKSENATVNELIPRLKTTDLGTTLSNGAPTTGILQLSMTDSNPIHLIQVLNAIAQETQKKDLQRKTQEAAKTLNFLTEQVPLTKALLEKAEKDLNLYRAKSGKMDVKLEMHSLLTQFNAIDDQLLNIRINRSRMLQEYTSEHPYMLQLDEKEKKLKEERNTLETTLKKLPASDQIAINLMREVKVKNDLYLILLNRMQGLRVTTAGTMSDVQIIAFATPPDAPVPVRKGLIVGSSFILGLLLGCFITFVRKALLQRIQDPHWIERNFNLINLAIIPYSKQQVIITANHNTNSSNQLSLLSRENSSDLSIEALRSLRTSLQVLLCSARNNIISIMGVSPGVGKSFISANFAYLLAEGGKRVLLIDGDMRRGHLQKYFQAAKQPGLAELIKNETTINEAIVKTHIDNLMFLPSGNSPAKPSELLMNGRLRELIQLFSNQFDLVVIDTPPILAVTDGILLGALSGTNFLVIGSHLHQPKEIEVAMKVVSSSGISLNGSIFNHIKKETKAYGIAQYQYSYEPR